MLLLKSRAKQAQWKAVKLARHQMYFLDIACPAQKATDQKQLYNFQAANFSKCNTASSNIFCRNTCQNRFNRSIRNKGLKGKVSPAFINVSFLPDFRLTS